MQEKDYTSSERCKSFKKYKGNRRQKLTTSEQEKLDIFDKHAEDFYDILATNTSLNRISDRMVWKPTI